MTTTVVRSARSCSGRGLSFLPRSVVAAFATVFVLVTTVIQTVDAVIPSVEVSIRTNNGSDPTKTRSKTTTIKSTTLLLSEAVFGPSPPFERTDKKNNDNSSSSSSNNEKRLVSSPDSNRFLCSDPEEAAADRDRDGSVLESTKGAWMLVPRGGCTYEYKTWIAQSIYESAGVIVHNTLATRYRFNETESESDNESESDGDRDGGNTIGDSSNAIVWPSEYVHYDCQNARAEIPAGELNFFATPDEALSVVGAGYASPSPYDFRTNDPLLSGDTDDNLCKLHDANDLRNCPSKRCVVAKGGGKDDNNNSNNNNNQNNNNNNNNNQNNSKDTMTVCCAWDIRLNPYKDIDLDKNVTITIPTLFATTEQGDIFSEAITMETDSSSLTITVYSRWRPAYNFSAVLIVLLGVAVAALASYRSAGDYHFAAFKLWKNATKGGGGDNTALQPRSGSGFNAPGQSLVPRTNSAVSEESLELEPIHAVVFLVMSSISLFVLFFFKIYNVAKVMYAFGCSNAFIQIMVYPLLSQILRTRFFRSSRTGKHCFRERIVYRSEELGDVTNWNILAGVFGYTVGIVWLYMALCIPQAGDKYTFYWITQDVLGLCICVVFLGIIQLNSIQVASVLLIIAFFYDIFFVFVTPYIFNGRSVMIEVATSGGPPKADELWCEKYPSDPDCKGGDPMPMLFSIPRLFDYQGGSSMLGLGDIVLPGLLLSFAARLDAARLVCALYSAGTSTSTGSTVGASAAEQQQGRGFPFPAPMPIWYALLFGGYGYYFVPVVVAYAVGLFMANAAVYLMNMGQPALLYLVPCTLGTMTYKGWKRNELVSLWNGPRVLKQADYVCYGDENSSQREEGGAASASVSVGTGTGTGTIDGMEFGDDFVEEGNTDAVPLMRSVVDPSGGDRSDSE